MTDSEIKPTVGAAVIGSIALLAVVSYGLLRDLALKTSHLVRGDGS